MEESEHDTEQSNSKQEKNYDHLRQNDKFVPKRGAASVAWTWFG